MPVISSGSLCADQYSIPQGYRRQYNLIEIDEVECKTKIHVREWFDNTSLISARLQEFGGKGWIIKDLPLLKERIKRRLQVLEKTSPSVDKAELLLREKKYEATLDLLKKLPQDIPIVRSLLVETLHSLGRWDDLMRLIPKPLNPTELTVLVDALCKKKNFDSAISIIQECEREPLTYDTGFISSLRKRVEAEKEGA
jgi:hypothetical protein